MEYRQAEPLKKLQKLSHLLIVDDAQGTDLYSNARRDLFTHIVIKHRHIPLTITLVAQSWMGIPRVIRLKFLEIYDTFANTIEFDKFKRMYKEAVLKSHGFLLIGTVPKTEYKRFRRGFNHYLS